ncbi:hypothetical protein SAMN04488107_2594 [Geodermatophilus saharensis]|uniref:Uncharacterized protein n=1 Tax=Geodermatophilus saharensis TaxID=1137994 RepID=A0A239EJ62_9ACTN|nr:hypothetical protein SAMN04488107_2594 [Geodermatophilus saharensis]
MGQVGRKAPTVCPRTWERRFRPVACHISRPRTEVRGAGILERVNRRLVLAGVIWAAASVLAFVAGGNALLALGLAVFGLVLLVVLAMAGDWDDHPDFEEREMARARRRREKWERNAGARARDRARWEAHQARKAGRD